MCGICGQYNFRSGAPVSMGKLSAMNDMMRHRGPNDEGIYANGPIGMAMRRLSIIDISSGKQPIHNEQKTVWIVFNGEIYNYKELRSILQKKGHYFYTASDTETIVHLYEEYAEACVTYLRGMFSFAIWDERNQMLFLARDRVGIKPLFYSATSSGSFIFASEPKSMLANQEINREIDPQALDAYFAYGYIPAPLCIYKQIRKLLPGHWMKIDASGTRTKKYWDLHFSPDYGKSQNYFIDRFEQIFNEAVKMRLMSEVPLGAFLSGGVDSSLVTAFMSNASRDSIHTFTVGFSGDTGNFMDERPFAKMVADKYGCQHNEITVEPSVDQILDKIVNAFDEPFADDSIIPSYYICEQSKHSVTVALTGLGGDELFAGYERYLGFHLSKVYDYVPRALSQKMILPFVESLPELKSGHYLVNHLKRFVRASHLPDVERYRSYVSIPCATRRRLYSPDLSGDIDMGQTSYLMGQYYLSDNANNPLDRAMYQDIKTYLTDDILTLTDRIGMMHSQELRVPFTDHKLMEFCATIPIEMKIRMLEKKHLLKKIASKYIPHKVLKNRKQGFCSPMARWIKTDLKPLVGNLLESEKIGNSGLFREKCVSDLIQQHLQGRELNDKLIFALIVFQKWYQNYNNQS